MEKIRKALDKFVSSVTGTLACYPVETGLLFYAFVVGVMMIRRVSMINETDLLLVPLFVALAFILNNLLHTRSRAEDASFKPRHLLYYLCWLPIIPLWWVDSRAWVESPQYVVALVCALLGVLSCRRVSDNRRFVSESLVYFVNAAVSFLFASIAFLLLLGIYYSIVYVFGIYEGAFSSFVSYAVLFTYVIAAPLLFFTFTRNNVGESFFPNKFFDILLNYILSPALLIYTAVLYIYFVKIAVQWELPRGGIAYMVFAFAITATLAKGCQPLLSRDYYGWFYSRFSLISVPALIMFWLAVVYRIMEYGYTEMRIYLLLCGLLMTATLFMFARREHGRYLSVALMIIVVLVAFSYIPPISAGNLAISSQRARVMKLADKLGMINPDGSFRDLEEMPPYDSAYKEDYEGMYASLYYLERHGAGIKEMKTYEFKETYSKADKDDTFSSLGTILLRNPVKNFDISGYSELHVIDKFDRTNETYRSSVIDGILTLHQLPGRKEVWSIPLNKLIEEQLEKIGMSQANPTIEKEHPEFFIYDTDSIRIVFSDVYVYPERRDGELGSIDIKLVLLK